MPMPHRTQMQLIKRRLVGKDGAEKVRELRAILAELPGYRNGPYADLRKWVESELERTRVRKRVVNRDSIAVRREGAAQIAVVGPPNAGKSSLLQALSNIQIKTGDYAFTTTRPVPALTRVGGVLLQLVEIPGLLEGPPRAAVAPAHCSVFSAVPTQSSSAMTQARRSRSSRRWFRKWPSRESSGRRRSRRRRATSRVERRWPPRSRTSQLSRSASSTMRASTGCARRSGS